MSLHVFAAFVTATGTAANNRGLTEGNITSLQKLVWNGQVHTTVSAESIRFALRRRLAEHAPCNRTFDEDERVNDWKDKSFSAWGKAAKGETFIDDDLLGFMAAEAGKQEGEKGSAKVRRAVLEVTRAVSLTPWPGDVTFNAASPGATPSAQKKGDKNPVPYGTELHATRYQYGVALTPSALRVEERATIALRALCALGPVAGNHGRFLFDFSPESVVFRVTHEAAPRILHTFQAVNGGAAVSLADLVRKVRAGDIPAQELVLGGEISGRLSAEEREALAGAEVVPGIQKACEAACARLKGTAR
jgi:CRISPR-associated protein Cst2